VGAVVSFNGLTASVAPIAVYRYHSADYQRDKNGLFRTIDSTEVNRVLGYWRYGYKPSTVGWDGFENASGYTGAGGRHSADFKEPYWVIDDDELSAPLAYWRMDGYHADPSEPDGYDIDKDVGTGPSPYGMLSFFSLSLPPAEILSAPDGYNPGQVLIITNTFVQEMASKLVGLYFTLDIPEGWTWTVKSLSSGGVPISKYMTNGSTVMLTGNPLPTASIQLVYQLTAPINMIGTQSFGCTAVYWYEDGPRNVHLSAAPLSLAPLDADGNGLADAWAAAYGVTDPDGDPDGDRMSNLEEYLCGTVPTDEVSYLRMVSVKPVPGRGVEISWSSEAGRVYTLQRAVGTPAGLEDFVADLPADPSGRNTYLDDTGLSAPCFYRVKLQQ
jgi:hypothetical protein